MLLGYNTNGMAHHDLLEAVDLLGELGYRSVAITIDHGVLAPGGAHLERQIERLRGRLAEYGMRSVIETGARFLLDSRRKHEPTLVSGEASARARRVNFYRHAIDCARELGSDCVSLWSGVLHDGAGEEEGMDRLVEGLECMLEYASERSVAIGFEPEPGMLIDSMARYEQMLGRIDSPGLGLTLDVGHLWCNGEVPIVDYVRRWGARVVNVHIEDMRVGVHEHLMFGDGEIDFPPVVGALSDAGYQGALHVELSRHSHEAPTAARRAFDFLDPILEPYRPKP